MLALPARALAQDDDTLRPPVDTARSRDSADAFRRRDAEARIRVPVMPRLAGEGPLPAGARMLIPRDSIEWAGAATVGDLLATVPGTYLWRGGGIGRPEPVNYRARGGASTEYFLDGLPYVALGPDSIAVDPALLPLGLIERIEVERWPGLLRVYLHTPRHDRLAARSQLVLAAGPHKLAKYSMVLERRHASGFGFGAGADYLKNPGTGGGEYQNTQFWVQGSYVPSARFGLQVQYAGASPDRDAFTDGGAAGERHEGRRGDLQARVFVGGRADGGGPHADLVFARASFDSSGIDQSVAQMGGALSHRGATWSLRASAYHRTRWTPLDAGAGFSWAPVPALSLAAEGIYRTYDGDRTSRWLGLRAGLGLPAGLSLGASARTGTDVAAPAILDNAAQSVDEIEGTAAWSLARIGVHASYARTKSFTPPAFQPFPGVATIARSGLTDWLTIGGRITPIPGITLEGWYADPRLTSGSAEGLPPDHYSASATLRSKFLRRFPSGALDLKLQLGVEGWRSGVLGEDGAGAPVPLPAARFIRGLAQLQLQSLSIFWESRNLAGRADGYVPGFRIPRYSGFFGARWSFNN